MVTKGAVTLKLPPTPKAKPRSSPPSTGADSVGLETPPTTAPLAFVITFAAIVMLPASPLLNLPAPLSQPPPETSTRLPVPKATEPSEVRVTLPPLLSTRPVAEAGLM